MESAMNQHSAKPTHSVPPLEHVTLDCDHILTHAGGDPQLLIQLCGTFLGELPMRTESLRCAIKDRDNLGVERALQQLQNCLIVFGPGPVSITAQALESAVRGGRIRHVQREWKRLECQLRILVPQVQRMMLEMSTPRSAVQ
jgi:hypothetical protein